jgi:hypothetical protein
MGYLIRVANGIEVLNAQVERDHIGKIGEFSKI